MCEKEMPQGFLSSGSYCGIKSDPSTYDLALFASETPCVAAGVFTQSQVCGAPVTISRERVSSDEVCGVILNSGNANACTGSRGLDDARWMTAQVAEKLDCEEDAVLVCSTGIIGHFLPIEKLQAGIGPLVDKLAKTPAAFSDAARGMMTTDTFPKQAMREANIGGKTIRVSGAAKGAAMIAPNMATMLAVLMTDAALNPAEADAMLRRAVERSFNCISVDGHTSTSDTVILLANGAAEAGAPGDQGSHNSSNKNEKETVQQMLDEVAEELAMAIIRDAEGADHFITLDVRGFRSRDEAHRVAKTVAESLLVKTAVTGADPNWGRIVSAAGYAGVDLREEDISLSINGTQIYKQGAPVEYDEQALSQSMRDNRDVSLEIECSLGEAAVRFWTCDLTCEYVRLNSEYTT